VVTSKKPSTARKLQQPDVADRKTNGDARSAKSKRLAAAADGVTDGAYTEARSSTTARGASGKHDSLMARGKDLLAGEAGGVAAAAAIVVGAALIEVELVPGLIIGAGAILLGKLFPELGAYARPAIKSAVRAGFSMTQKAREVMAEASEQVHDLVAEVKHEQAGSTHHAKPQRAGSKAAASHGEQPVH
jgi:hypothetical protein